MKQFDEVYNDLVNDISKYNDLKNEIEFFKHQLCHHCCISGK